MSELVHFPSTISAARRVTSRPAAPAPQLIGGVIHDTAGEGRYLDHYPLLPLSVAPSCLLAPHAGDVVSAVIYEQQIYVIAVLQRQCPDAPLVLNGGDVALHLVAPSLMLRGAESVGIETPRLSLLTRTSRWVADTLHQVAHSLFVRAGNAHRKVEYADELEARHISQHADQSMALNARMGSINASAVLKIDGGQVHMG